MIRRRLIETDDFAFEFLSQLAERESWRKEVHRPIYHVHKWWAKRLGTVFRGLLLGCVLDENADLPTEFYNRHAFSGVTVFDPFMGSGTTIGEAHKLGLSAFGQDINPVAVESVRVALGPLDRREISRAFANLWEGIGKRIQELYQSRDSRGRACDVLYYFWVMQTVCPSCRGQQDLFSSYVIAKNARPEKKTNAQILCPACGHIFSGHVSSLSASCPSCGHRFDPQRGPVAGRAASCTRCGENYAILDALGGKRPPFRLYGKLVLTKNGEKEYLAASAEDLHAYAECSSRLQEIVGNDKAAIPTLALQEGYNTRQAMRYGFHYWRDFFNDRQLLALSLLHSAIAELADEPTRRALLTLLSGVLEFNNVFASYKGEGTGAVRHMFAHHILKPERTPIEANVWGTAKSSGSFSNLFRSRLLRAIDYREAPTEVNGTGSASGRVCSPPFAGEVCRWGDSIPTRGIALSCGDSSTTTLAEQSIDLIVTDPPFFDNVHYSELADFFFAWQQAWQARPPRSTRNKDEVQDSDAERFSQKLLAVFRECHRVLKDDGLLVFTYHHSRRDGWKALASAVLSAGFLVVNAHPVKSEMSVATPKSQANDPIQLDIVIVCEKAMASVPRCTAEEAIISARRKLSRLQSAGFRLSQNDRKVIIYGQFLTTLATPADTFPDDLDDEAANGGTPERTTARPLLLFPVD